MSRLIIIILILVFFFMITKNRVIELFTKDIYYDSLPIIVYINLDRDITRRSTMEKIFTKLKYPTNKVIRFSAIKK